MQNNCTVQNGPLLSVLVPVYGEDEFLDECIESIVNQTYKNLEIILVDDGSPDKCPEICDRWKEKDNRIVVIHKTNGGLVSGRKVGMQRATGEYIGYVDGDDWLDEDYFSTMMNAVLDNNADAVTCGFCKELNGKSITCTNHISQGVYRDAKMVESIYSTMIFDEEISMGGLYTYVWNKVFKRDKVYKHQLDVPEQVVVGEDAACVYPALLDCNSLVVLDYAGYHYRQRKNSLLRSMSINETAVQRLQIFYKYISNSFKDRIEKEKLNKQVLHYYANQLIMMTDTFVEVYKEFEPEFPFYEVNKGDRVIIYSAGAFGIHLYNQYRKNEYCNVVAWCDPDYEQYKKEDGVVSLEEALKQPFDKIVIASVDQRFIKHSDTVFLEWNIDESKICRITNNYKRIIEKFSEAGLLNEK